MSGTPFALDGGAELSVNCSIGFACFPLAPLAPRALDWSATLNLADAALYEAKNAGRNRWVGVLKAPGDDMEKMEAAALRPSRWLASGALETVRS